MAITKDAGYYDFEMPDIESVLMSETSVDELFYLRDLKQRKIYLTFDISQDSVADAIRHILQFNREDMLLDVEARTPIIIYIASCGGDEDAGFALIDAIINSRTPVYTVNIGYEYSMAFLIGLAGHERFATKNAKFLMHDGEVFINDSMTKMKDYSRFRDQIEDRTKQYVLSHSKITEDEYEKKRRSEWYMFADEAKEKGFVDYIIGEDCDIDAVV